MKQIKHNALVFLILSLLLAPISFAADDNTWITEEVLRQLQEIKTELYRMSIGENYDGSSNSKRSQITARLLTLTPISSDGINGFLKLYEKRKRYILGYAFCKKGRTNPTTPQNRKLIYKSHLNIIEASEIGLNDLDRVAIIGSDHS